MAEDLEDDIEAVKGVLEVNLIGGLEREVQVNVDLNALQGYNLTFSDLIETVQSENANIPGGSIDIDRLNYLVRVSGEFRDPAEIEDLVVDAPGGKLIDDVYQALMGLGLNSFEARSKLDSLLQSGKPFAAVPDAIELIFRSKGD